MIDGIPDIMKDIGLVGIFIRIFNKEIDYWVTALSAYYTRPYDVDRNPKTHDWCKLYNPGSGGWEVVSLTFRLTPKKGGNGVFIHYYDHTTEPWQISHVQRVSFLEWKDKQKARISYLPDTNKPVHRE